MKITASILVVLFLLMGLQESYSQIRVPQPSPLCSLNQKIGLMDASVVYSRPSKKGRKIFGDLVPFGEMWRTGANASSKISFSDAVKLEGQNVPAGTYSIFSIPEKDKWTIMINKGEGWGDGSYKKEEDVARFEVKPIKTANQVETFTIDFSDLTNNSANINISWENTLVRFGLTTDEDQKIMASITSTLASGNATANDYNAAASYLFDNNKELNKALEYVNTAISKYEEEKRNVFWVYHLKAKIQGKMSKFNDAIQTAEKSKALAQEAKNQDYVRLNDKYIKEWKPKAKS